MRFELSTNIMSNKKNTNNYWSIICYYLKIKRYLNITFHSQIDKQIKKQNYILKYYLQYYCNFKQNNWASLYNLYIMTRNIRLSSCFFFRNFNNLLFKLFLQIERQKTKYFNREKLHSKFKNIAKTIDKTIDARRKVVNKINKLKI